MNKVLLYVLPSGDIINLLKREAKLSVHITVVDIKKKSLVPLTYSQPKV